MPIPPGFWGLGGLDFLVPQPEPVIQSKTKGERTCVRKLIQNKGKGKRTCVWVAPGRYG